MWLLPLLVLGAVSAVVIAISRSPREPALPPPPRQLAFPQQPSPFPAPGPISVLGEFVRVGQVPPPMVIVSAIAEAEMIGRCDLATDIVRAFVAPVVYQHELTNAKRTRAYQRGTCALPRSPRSTVDARGPATQAPMAPMPEVPTAPAPERRMPSSDDDIRAMLNDDPEGFLRMVAHKAPMHAHAPVIDVPTEAMHPASMPQSMPPQSMEPPHPSVSPMPQEAQPTGLPPEAVAQMQEAAGEHDAADQTRAMAPGSPLAGVPDGAWREFVMRLERESPMFQSSRHVGQYRQRRERLAELGIDPNALLGSAQAQRAALDADLSDAHHHAVAGGLIEHVGRKVMVPGDVGPETITLSGMLGVIQCAGLDGAVGWLERASDRKRYPHTTQAFLNTNGTF